MRRCVHKQTHAQGDEQNDVRAHGPLQTLGQGDDQNIVIAQQHDQDEGLVLELIDSIKWRSPRELGVDGLRGGQSGAIHVAPPRPLRG